MTPFGGVGIKQVFGLTYVLTFVAGISLVSWLLLFTHLLEEDEKRQDILLQVILQSVPGRVRKGTYPHLSEYLSSWASGLGCTLHLQLQLSMPVASLGRAPS